MKTTMKFILLFILLISSNIFAQSGYLKLHTKSYKRYKLFGKKFEGGSTTSHEPFTPSFPYIGCTYKCNHEGKMYSNATGAKFFDTDMIFNMNAEVYAYPEKIKQYHKHSRPYSKIFKVLIKPVLSKNLELIGAQYCLINYKKDKDKGDNVYRIENKFYTDKTVENSKILSFVNKKSPFKNRRLKVQIYNSWFYEEFVIIDFKYFLNNPGPLTRKKTIEEKLPKGATLIQAPVNYDLLYTNSVGDSIRHENVSQNDLHEIIIGTVEKVDKFTKKKEFTRYSITSEIYPIKFKNNKLKFHIIFYLTSTSLDENGKKHGSGSRKFIKTLSCELNNVLKIKLPNQWTQEEWKISEDKHRIEHFFTISPVKKISKNIDEDYFKANKVIPISENDKIN